MSKPHGIPLEIISLYSLQGI